MSSSQLDSAAATTMTPTAISSASAASSPLIVSSTIIAPASSTKVTQQQQQQLLVASPPPPGAPLHHIDPLADSLPGADPSYGQQHISRAQPYAVQDAKNVSQQVPRALTGQERSSHDIDSPQPSSSLPSARGQRSTSQNADAAYPAACLDHKGAPACAKPSVSATSTVTTPIHTDATRVQKVRLPASSTYDRSSSESGADAAAAQPSRRTLGSNTTATGPHNAPLKTAAAISCVAAATAVTAVPRREKRRPPSLFSNSPTMVASPIVTTRPVLIPPAVGRVEDRLPTISAAAAATVTGLLPPSATQATPSTSPLAQINQSLHGQLKRPPAPPPRTSGSPIPSSTALTSCVPPTNTDIGGGEEGPGEGRLSTPATRGAHEQADARTSMKPTTYTPAHVTSPAVLTPCSTPPTAESHYGPLHDAFASAAAGGGGCGCVGTPNATLPARNSSLGGFDSHCGAGSLGSGVVAASANCGSAPTASLITATTTAGANRPHPPPAVRLPAAGVSGGGTAAAGVLSPLSLSAAAPTAFTARRRPPPPLLFRLRSPVGPAPLSTISTNDTSGDAASPGSAAPRSTTSRAAASATAAAASAGTSSSVLAATPMRSRPLATTMNSGGASDVMSTTADRAPRGSGCNPPATPARSGPLARAHHGSLNQNLNTLASGTRSAGGGLVRLSHDRCTLVAGMFRVSRDGCLTVRNMLLLNPTRIDAESATGAAVGPETYGSLMGSSATDTGGGGGGGGSRPQQLLHPQRWATTYSPIMSSIALAGRIPLLGPGGGADLGVGGGVGGGASGLGPMTPYTTGTDWCLPSTYYGSGGGAANTRPVQSSGGGGGAHNAANASFTLFSTSMDTPFSPITYSMDSQRLALPSPLGGHNDKGVAAGLPPPLGTTPNSTATLGRPPAAGGGGGSSSMCRAQLRRQASNSWLPGVLGTTNATSPPALGTAGSPGSIAGAGVLTDTDTTSILPLPNADVPAWRGATASGAGGSCVGSPSLHANLGGFRATTAAPAAAARTSSSAAPQNTPCAPLPPNVVRLRDLDVLSTAVGEGASAKVFVAIHRPTGRRLAVKRVDLSPLCLGCSSPYLRSGSSSSGRINQLQHIVVRELQVLHLTYRSPFMVKVYNAFFIAELAALDIVMEFMHYGSLDHLSDCLQKHARMVRECQQQRHRLLTGDDDDVDGDEEGNGHHGSPSATPPLCDALEAPQLAGGSRKNVSAFGAASGSDEWRLSMTTAPPKLLDSRRTLVERAPPVSLVPRKLSAIGISGWGDMDSVGGGGVVSSHPAAGGYKHLYDSDDSLLHDSYSVKSDCGTDDVESDDGSGLVEEPFGVTERLVAVVGEQLLRGVRDMHSRGYIHHDIKPGNVLVNEHGVVKLSDFGLSQRCDSSGIGIKNPMLTCIPPASVVPTRSTTPLQSPSMAALQLTGTRVRRTPFIGHAQRGSVGPGASGHLGSGVAGTTPTEMASSVEGLLLSSTTNSLLAQHEGMDVLEAESTSSEEGADDWGRTGRGRGRLSPSSSSTNDAENCCGTSKYMSPERQRGEPHGKPADIWAVGVTLAEFAVGEYPYDLKDVIDEFDRVSRMERPVDVLPFNRHRAVPLGTVFADFCRLATLPTASQRPTAQELLEHPFFKQWHRPFNLKDYLAARVPVPSNRMKAEYLAKQRECAQEGGQPAESPG
ncbi:hypothetical protein LSCM4_06281 [Leishmania orientalis]|uniref:mitogen-activated protein kinase kinase n=1 Tax=Leishmania orientalis TaxID=2249476 RepID=A0A836KTV9_9TRYP|nr:hypothetical protein LSCM4_06281 [Leishmania orientalis]